MHRPYFSGRVILRVLLAGVLLTNLGCQTTSRAVDPSASGQHQPYVDPQERPRNGPGEGWILLRRLSL